MRTLLLSILTACACFGQESFTLNSVVPGEQPAAATGGGSSSTLYTDLVSVWHLNETSDGSAPVTRVDSETTGTARDLTDNNTTASGTGKIGNAADFEKDNTESLSVSDNADLSAGSGVSFTVALWFKIESDISMALASKDSGGTGTREWVLDYSSGGDRLTFRTGQPASSSFASSQTATAFGLLSVGTWYHVVCVHNADTDQNIIYMNGGYATTASSVTQDPPDTSAPFQIGIAPFNNNWDGMVDAVKFWRRALSSTEVTELYNAENAGTTYPNW